MAYENRKITKDESYYKELVLGNIPNVPNGTSSVMIANVTGMTSRDVRFVIQKLRDDGNPICGTPDKGYWIARNSDDMQETLNKLEAHINNTRITLNALIKCQKNMMRKEIRGEMHECE